MIALYVAPSLKPLTAGPSVSEICAVTGSANKKIIRGIKRFINYYVVFIAKRIGLTGEICQEIHPGRPLDSKYVISRTNPGNLKQIFL
jgi:hypothetical protein